MPIANTSVHLDRMKALVSTALWQTIWSIISKMRGETTAMLCFSIFQPLKPTQVPDTILRDWRALIEETLHVKLNQTSAGGRSILQVGALL